MNGVFYSCFNLEFEYSSILSPALKFHPSPFRARVQGKAIRTSSQGIKRGDYLSSARHYRRKVYSKRLIFAQNRLKNVWFLNFSENETFSDVLLFYRPQTLRN